MALTVKTNGNAHILVEQSDSLFLKKMFYAEQKTDIAAANSGSLTIPITVPSGYEYVGVISCHTSGTAAPLYVIDVDSPTTSTFNVTAWIFNYQTYTLSKGYYVNVYALFQKIS
jgi:hypothetical protein